MNYVPREDQHNHNVSEESSLSSFVILFSAAALLCLAIFFSGAWLGEKVILMLSPQQEISSFSAWTKSMGEPWPEGKRILEKLIGKDSEHYTLVVLPQEDPNAFAFPGRVLGVTCGLIQGLKSENGLAFVFGHELGHFAHQDHLRGIGRSLGLGAGMMILGFPMESGFAQLGQQLLARTFSREQESAADLHSIDLMKSVYGGLQGATELFELIQENKNASIMAGGRWERFLSTHPAPESRAEVIRNQGMSDEEVLPLSDEVIQICAKQNQ